LQLVQTGHTKVVVAAVVLSVVFAGKVGPTAPVAAALFFIFPPSGYVEQHKTANTNFDALPASARPWPQVILLMLLLMMMVVKIGGQETGGTFAIQSAGGKRLSRFVNKRRHTNRYPK
ncbi:hypothetical protein M514_02573, partial [Trichuris suis]